MEIKGKSKRIRGTTREGNKTKLKSIKIVFPKLARGAKWAGDCQTGFCEVFLHGSYTVPVGSALSPGTGWWGDRSKMAPELGIAVKYHVETPGTGWWGNVGPRMRNRTKI